MFEISALVMIKDLQTESHRPELNNKKKKKKKKKKNIDTFSSFYGYSFMNLN